jgi:penicillin-binding protein 2
VSRPREATTRMRVLGLVALALMGLLVGRLGQVQVAEHADHQRAAETVNTRTLVTPALRGRILDRHGVPLADNSTQTVVSVERRVLTDAPDGGRALVARVAAALHQPVGRLWERTRLCGSAGAAPAPACWAGSPQAPVPLVTGVDPAVALTLVERPDDFPGVTVAAAPVRDHPHADEARAAHVLGYLGRTTAEDVAAAGGRLGEDELVGRSGLEQQYDAQLRGTPGRTVVSVDPRGVVTGTVSVTPPVPGRDLVTTLDLRVQTAAEESLRAAVQRARAKGLPADSGAAVVLDTTSGAVLAAASHPDYDPGIWTGGVTAAEYADLTDPAAGSPLVSRIAGATFPPASTFKVVSLPAAVAAGNRLDGTYDCSSGYTIGNRRFANFESRAYGPIGLRRAIEVSCDTVFYDFAYRSWLAQGGLATRSDAHDPFVTTARSFGLGTPTGVDLPGERAGVVPGRAWKQSTWQATRADTCARARTGYPELARTEPGRAAYLRDLAREGCASGHQFRAGDAANFSIGQGDLAVTPLQMARLYAAVGNGGTLWRPQLARALVTPAGARQELAPERAGTVTIPAATTRLLQGALRGVVDRGSAYAAFRGFPLDTWPVAGKTGTAEVFGARDTAWFVSYAPADRPRYAVAVVVSQGGLGGSTAAPAARRIHDVLRTLP